MPYSKDDRKVKFIDFNTLKVGDKAEITHNLAQEDVDAFASLTGDYNPLHIDAEFAKKTLFQKPVVHGMISASFISTMIGMLVPGGGSLWMSQSIEFLRPAFIGDIIKVTATISQKSIATRILTLKIIITNQRGEELITGDSTVKMLKLIEERKSKMQLNEKKNILITGGSRGIGAATAIKLASEGHSIIVNYMNSKNEADKIVEKIIKEGGKAIALKANVAKLDEVIELFSSAKEILGPIQAVVHCAAPNNAPQAFDKLNWESFLEQIDIHLKGAFNCTKQALPEMKEAKSGDFIFIGTIYTDGMPPTLQARYVTAKSALVSLARCLAVEYGHLGIRFNIVAPGMTQTDMIANLPDKVKMLTKMQTPLRSLAEPTDIANSIAFLLSPAAQHITGETIRVCGGLVMI